MENRFSNFSVANMRIHHTKNKGDLGVAKAYCDLVEKGYIVLFPATEHAPFDLVLTMVVAL